MTKFLEDENATLAFGKSLAKYCQLDNFSQALVIYLHGDLGAGKSTLARGLIQHYLPVAKVKSPTYTLVEEYDVSKSSQNHTSLKQIYHFDLYRLGDPEELEYLGGRDYFSANSVCLIEWPQRGEGWLPEPDLEIMLEYRDDGRNVELQSHSEKGQQLSEKVLTHGEHVEKEKI